VTRDHLDRCLTCRNCETTCPSGVQYGRLIDIGREMVDRLSPRPASQQLLRAGLRKTLTGGAAFGQLAEAGTGRALGIAGDPAGAYSSLPLEGGGLGWG
jgi:glycolate oxidase iron-sulfur subunit